MGGYLLGLATLPAVVVAVGAIYGLYRAGQWLLNNSPLVRMKISEPEQRAIAGAAVASVRTMWVLNLSKYVNIWFSFGPVDIDMYAKNYRALRPLPPAPKIRDEWLDRVKDGEQ